MTPILYGSQKSEVRKMSSNNVVQDWLVNNCSWKQQTVVIVALRGCDYAIPKENPSKKLSRMMRNVVLKNADSTTTFMQEKITKEEIDEFIDFMDALPIHYIMHFTHASAIIGYYHPNEKISEFWDNLYHSIIYAFHLKPETKNDIELRLKDKI